MTGEWASNLRGLDKHTRYVEAARGLEHPRRILDVGGGKGDFLDFAQCRGVIAEIEPHRSLFGRVRSPHPVITFDGERIPFKDGSFDVVVCLDTIEHVPKLKRQGLLSEILRVSRDKVILTFPAKQYFFTVLMSLACFYDRIGVNHVLRKALEEHLRNGLPTRQEVLSAVQGDGIEVSEEWFFGPGATLLWIGQLCLPFLATAPFNRTFAAMIRTPTNDTRGSQCLLVLRKSNG